VTKSETNPDVRATDGDVGPERGWCGLDDRERDLV
jgi:hypothetical protein